MSALGQAIPEGFKQTDVGTIPEDWKDEQLFELVKVIDGDRGHNYPSANDFSSDGYCVFLSASNVTKKGFSFKDISFINKTKDEALRKGKLKRNDIVLTTRGTVGQYAFYDETIGYEHLRINSGMVLVRVISKEIKPDYLYSVLKSHIVQKQLSTMSFGSAQPQLTVRDINNFIVCYPSGSKEQTAIANALSDIDALLTELEKLVAKKQAIKTATMRQLLTGKTRLPQFATHTVGEKKEQAKGTKPSELGEIPEDWDVSNIGSVLSITTGSRNTQDKLSDGQYPFFVRSQTIERINTYSFDGEAVLTAGDGVGTGKIFHYINGKFDYHQRVYLMHNFGDRIDGYYFYIYFSNFFYDRIMSMTAKSSVDSVRREMIADMLITLPPKEEQVAIATILSDMDNEIQTLEQRLTKTRQIKQGMMQQLLTGRTRLPFKKLETEQDGGS
ncbi:MAG TPA: restriction endonuclease subunit S [Pseudoalteromonas sp.]|uniref:Type I restriction modification DNA specificity domain-containing protein n=1 Tax=marine sediment metagenome TaxID=412755 RepID=A0A0F9S5D5_9ZZZZ|nr:restriction endonuclease subunit S [Pseudoalteromonas sp.]HDY92997.1 restriction endonuclease subunit S [Pseudoalteromonas sp.]HDZ34620.1 restriction endonuclease subunit S [Pseudoalteromonas sp.]